MGELNELEREQDIKILNDMSKITGIKYSDEQKQILLHRGGMCILACAGSGKTSILTHLLAKRIQTHEIQNIDTLLCTTYSTGGAEEMEQRVTKLFSVLGINKKITVKTMHALYLGVLKDFGYPSTVIEAKDRRKYILEACRDIEVILEEEDFQTLDSLLSYQVNNLLSDSDLVRSYAYTLETVSLEQYSSIRKGYNLRKIQYKVVDFDDMQLYMYSLLYQQNREDILNYCRSKWVDIYVDEAQDMSRIQYAILKKILTDASKLTIIGDDDQCLPADTCITTIDKRKHIKDVVVGDMVLTANGQGEQGFHMVEAVSCKDVDEDIVVIKTKSGHRVRGTTTHIGFAITQEDLDEGDYINEDFLNQISSSEETDNTSCWLELGMFVGEKTLGMYGSSFVIDDYSNTELLEGALHVFESNSITTIEDCIKCAEIELKRKGVAVNKRIYARLTDNEYYTYKFGELTVGMHMAVQDSNGNIVDTVIDSIEHERYIGKVYDLSVPSTRNFIANGIVVHNCIYQWRGADPSIILNVCAEYDIQRFVLSTNYRCAGNIVEKAAIGIQYNSKRSDKSMKPYNKGGDIKICDCGSSNLYTMSKYAYKHIRKLVMEDDVAPNKIAVLSRNNSHLCILSNMLFKDGIHCDATSNMKMTRSIYYRNIKDVLELAMNSYNGNITESTLFRVCVYLKKADAKRIGKIQSDTGVKLSDILGYIATKYWKRTDINWTGSIKIPGLAEATMAQFLSYLKNDTIENLVLIYKLLTDDDMVKRANGLLALYLTATEYLYREKPDKKRSIEGLVDYMIDLIKTMGFNETKQFLRVSEQYEEGRMAVPGLKVCMSTMHGAKGKEWDNVVLFADDNVTFPSFGGIVTQLKSGIAMSDIYYGIDENRRLHYVAMTRARKSLAIFTDSKNIGLYILEAMGVFNYGAGNNAHIVSMATEGEVYKSLLDDSNKVIFGDESKYNYKIDISDMSANIEIDYLYRGNNDNRQTVSIDDIQTGTPQKFID